VALSPVFDPALKLFPLYGCFRLTARLSVPPRPALARQGTSHAPPYSVAISPVLFPLRPPALVSAFPRPRGQQRYPLLASLQVVFFHPMPCCSACVSIEPLRRHFFRVAPKRPVTAAFTCLLRRIPPSRHGGKFSAPRSEISPLGLQSYSPSDSDCRLCTLSRDRQACAPVFLAPPSPVCARPRWFGHEF